MSERYVIPSIERALGVLETLAQEPRGHSLAELGRRMDIPKSTLFRILVTLQKHQCVVWSDDERTFRLGSRLWEFGTSFLDHSDLFQASTTHMKRLAETSRETVFLGCLEDGEVIYLRRMESPKSITMVRKLKQRVPAHCTATGVAILAFMKESEVSAILDRHGLASYSDTTLTDREKFMQRLATVRNEGYAIVDGEYNRELLCISAPIFDHRRQPAASLTVAMVSSQARFDTARVEGTAALVREAARAFSRDLGYSANGSR